jgi:hypothetical protein
VALLEQITGEMCAPRHTSAHGLVHALDDAIKTTLH